MVEYTREQAAAFEGAYCQLKKAKIDEDYLARHRKQILSSANDGVSDADLVLALKAAYPSIVVTRHTLKKLRAQWVLEPALPAADTSGI